MWPRRSSVLRILRSAYPGQRFSIQIAPGRHAHHEVEGRGPICAIPAPRGTGLWEDIDLDDLIASSNPPGPPVGQGGARRRCSMRKPPGPSLLVVASENFRRRV